VDFVVFQLDLPDPSTPETNAAVAGLMAILEDAAPAPAPAPQEDAADQPPAPAADKPPAPAANQPAADQPAPAPLEEQPAPSISVVSKHSAGLTCCHLVCLQESLRKEMDERMATLSTSFNAKIDGLMRLLQARLPPAS
jgi:hypothetical protein